MLKMQSLSKVYRTEMIETYALREFNLDVREGEFVAVTGPSGSGKTTFLTIAGLLEAFTGGRYELDGVDVSRMDDTQRSRMRNEKIGFIFQAFNLIPDLNVLDNIEVPLRYRGMKSAERQQRARDALARVGLEGYGPRKPALLSGGERQRVALARAFVRRRPILLLDEPFAALDPAMRAGMAELLRELRAETGSTLLFITHQLEDVRRLADRAMFVDDGAVALMEPLGTFLENRKLPALAEFLGIDR